MNNVIIIGSGPAGLTAAIYAARANLEPLVISGSFPGGQLMITSEVENFPGFPEGIMGPMLMSNMRQQAEKFGARFNDTDVLSVDFTAKPFKVTTDKETFEAKAVIIATGASSIWLEVPNERRLIGSGISSCATCDGAFFKNKEIAVVGGGDSAMEEATFLTKFASKVHVLVRKEELRASKIMQDRAKENPKIEFHFNTQVEDVFGDKKLEGVHLVNTKTNEKSDMKLDGLFVAIGHKPNTSFLQGKINQDETGYILTEGHGSYTNIEGVFVAGDVYDKHYRQAITAAAAGCMAAIDCEKYLEK